MMKTLFTNKAKAKKNKKEKKSQKLSDKKQDKNYVHSSRKWMSRRKAAKHPKGLTPVVTPKPGDTKPDPDNLTEDELLNEKENSAPSTGEEHFRDKELMGRYEFIRYLGHGSYGHVCEGRDVNTGNRVAIKKIPKVFDNEIDAKRLLRELRILRMLRYHEAIVDLVDILPPPDLDNFNTIILVFEFVDTDLSKLIQSDQYFTTLHVQYMLYQVMLGLKYMHSGNIAHRDLKPANILVNEDCTLKICDFGLARGLTENVKEPKPVSAELLDDPTDKKTRVKNKPKRELTRHVVTRWYRSPEVILLQQKRENLCAVDMWSIGCILAELCQMQRENCRVPSHRKPLFPGSSCFPLSARDPFAYADRMDQLNVIFDVIGTPTPEEIDKLTDDKARKYLYSLPKKNPVNLKRLFPGATDEGLSLLRGLIHFDVSKRMTVDEALAHPFLARVRDEDAEKRHKPESFEFEDVAVSLYQLRALIVDEIVNYNPDLLDSKIKQKRRSSGKGDSHYHGKHKNKNKN